MWRSLNGDTQAEKVGLIVELGASGLLSAIHRKEEG